MNYYNDFQTQSQIDTLNFPNYENQGTWSLDTNNALFGNQSLKMVTNANLSPYYFYLFSPQTYQDAPLRLEVTACLKTDIKTFGIGWQVIKNGNLAVVFTRMNFSTNVIELLINTSPHIWKTISTIPYNMRRDNVLQPFRMWLDISPMDFSYLNFGIHAFCKESTNKWEYTLSDVCAPNTESAQPDGLIVKINPQGNEGFTSTSWLGYIKATDI